MEFKNPCPKMIVSFPFFFWKANEGIHTARPEQGGEAGTRYRNSVYQADIVTCLHGLNDQVTLRPCPLPVTPLRIQVASNFLSRLVLSWGSWLFQPYDTLNFVFIPQLSFEDHTIASNPCCPKAIPLAVTIFYLPV